MPVNAVGTPVISLLFAVGAVPSLPENGTIIVDWAVSPGALDLGPFVCAYDSNCVERHYATGGQGQFDASANAGLEVLGGTELGDGVGTEFTMCVSVFDGVPVPTDFVGLENGKCVLPDGYMPPEGDEEPAPQF